MARKLNLQAVQFSERSGLVKDEKAAELILREYENRYNHQILLL